MWGSLEDMLSHNFPFGVVKGGGVVTLVSLLCDLCHLWVVVMILNGAGRILLSIFMKVPRSGLRF